GCQRVAGVTVEHHKERMVSFSRLNAFLFYRRSIALCHARDCSDGAHQVFAYLSTGLAAFLTRKPLRGVSQHELVALFNGVRAFPDLRDHFSILIPRSRRFPRRTRDPDGPALRIVLLKIEVAAHPPEDHRFRDRALLRSNSEVD